IRVRHLWHRFGSLDVLKDVTFDVWPGEIFGFIGPNGAGKTTTIRVMATLLEPMAGRVEIDGIDVTIDPASVRKRIGYMPDHSGVYERITVREYLEFFADAYRVPSLEVVDAVLELTDMTKIQDRVVATMSKGMKQRLQLGRILLHDPKVLILDEPASDLDPRARIEIRDLLLELKALGKTIFLSSHILTELSDVCTSICILEKGRVIVAGPINEIAARLEAMKAAQAVGHEAHHAPYAARAQRYAQVAHHRPYGPATYAGHPSHPQHGPHAPPYAGGPYGHPQGGPGYPQGGPVHSQGGPAHSQVVQPPPQAYGPPAQPYGGQPAPPMAAYAPPAGPRPDQGPYASVPQQPAPAPHAAGPHAVRRKVKIRVLGNPEMAAYLVRGGPGILEADVIGGVVHVGFVGTDVKIAEIVQHLVRNGAGVVGVEQERNELERIFLEVTRGEMQ
ncbi:MAG: ATP-binding cassette domain-containing protein, partial [Polyangiaceae bacterium]|nr:ATP-binding cassette domain-containing protein [Polyangiaceae bacterium]